MNPRDAQLSLPQEVSELTQEELEQAIHDQCEKEIKPYLDPTPPSKSFIQSVASYLIWLGSNQKKNESEEIVIQNHIHLSR